MSPRTSFRLIAATLLLGVISPSATAASGCGGLDIPVTTMPDRSWIESDHPLYVFDDEGRFVQRGLDERESVVISDRLPRYSRHDQSSDRRWLLYNADAVTLFDLRTGASRALTVPEERPIAGVDNYGWRSFSPDSRWLSVGFDLYELPTNRWTAIDQPPAELLAGLDRFVTAYWSADGNSLFIKGFDDANDPVFLEYSPIPNGRWRSVESPDDQGQLPTLVREGVEIELARDAHPESHSLYPERRTSDGRRTAKVDDEFRLVVTSAGGPSFTAATGRYDECEGVTIGIHGWVEDRYLLYSIGNVPYVSDAQTGKQALLFDEETKFPLFFW